MADLAGNTLETALNVGLLTSTQSYSDLIGDGDYSDYYRLTIGENSDFNVTLSGLSSDANVRILDSRGFVIQEAATVGTASELIARKLQAGDYYVQVYKPGSGNTAYNLQVSATALGANVPVSGTIDQLTDLFFGINLGSISADGRYVAYSFGDANGSFAFVADRLTGKVQNLSVAADGTFPPRNTYVRTAFISANGQYVAFDSDATNLVSGDINGVSDIFVRNLATGVTQRVSVASDGTQANGKTEPLCTESA